jgi:chromosome segregation ATPase
VYAEFLHELDKWTKATQQVRELARDSDVLYLNESTPEIDAAMARFEEHVKSIPKGRELTTEEVKAIQAEADRLRDELEKLKNEDNARFEKGSAKVTKMGALRPVLEEHMDRLHDLVARMNMLAGQPVIDAANAIVIKAALGELSTVKDTQAFNTAVRKELGTNLRD